ARESPLPPLLPTTPPADGDRHDPAVGEGTSGFPPHCSAQFATAHPAIAEMEARTRRQYVRRIGNDEVKRLSRHWLEQVTLAGRWDGQTVEGSVEAGICQRPWVDVRRHYLVAKVQCEQRMDAGAGAEIEDAPSL